MQHKKFSCSLRHRNKLNRDGADEIGARYKRAWQIESDEQASLDRKEDGGEEDEEKDKKKEKKEEISFRDRDYHLVVMRPNYVLT